MFQVNLCLTPSALLLPAQIPDSIWQQLVISHPTCSLSTAAHYSLMEQVPVWTKFCCWPGKPWDVTTKMKTMENASTRKYVHTYTHMQMCSCVHTHVQTHKWTQTHACANSLTYARSKHLHGHAVPTPTLYEHVCVHTTSTYTDMPVHTHQIPTRTHMCAHTVSYTDMHVHTHILLTWPMFLTTSPWTLVHTVFAGNKEYEEQTLGWQMGCWGQAPMSGRWCLLAAQESKHWN